MMDQLNSYLNQYQGGKLSLSPQDKVVLEELRSSHSHAIHTIIQAGTKGDMNTVKQLLGPLLEIPAVKDMISQHESP